MPRKGRHPLKEKSIEEKQIVPKKITMTTIVFIPSLTGYWQYSFEVLKLFFQSLIENTKSEFDLMVFDNGSCKKIIKYLNKMKDRGFIQYLILSDKNYRKLGALDYLLKSAPGQYISYADSDVFFLPNWLNESIRVLETFSKAAKVTAIPIVGGDTTIISNKFYKEALKDKEINVSTGDIVEEKFIRSHSMSIGKSLNEFILPDRKDILLKKNKTQAFLSTADFQFTIKKEAVFDILPLVISKDNHYYDPIYSPVLEHKLDEDGWWQLSTRGYHIHHMGNHIPNFENEIPWMQSKFLTQIPNNALTSKSKHNTKIKSTRMRRLLKKINLWSYRKLYE